MFRLFATSLVLVLGSNAWATSSYSGWISFFSTNNSYDIEIQGATPGQTGEDWALLQFTTQIQENLARHQMSSLTRPLTHVLGDDVAGTADLAHHRLNTVIVTRLVVCPEPGTFIDCMPIVSQDKIDVCDDQSWIEANCAGVSFVD